MVNHTCGRVHISPLALLQRLCIPPFEKLTHSSSVYTRTPLNRTNFPAVQLTNFTSQKGKL